MLVVYLPEPSRCRIIGAGFATIAGGAWACKNCALIKQSKTQLKNENLENLIVTQAAARNI
jgi:hypothetical protein